MTPYVLPFALYLGLTQALRFFPDECYPALYAAVVLLVALVTGYFLKTRRLLRPHARILPAVGVGLAGVVLWVVLAHLEWEKAVSASWPEWLRPGPRPAFDPFARLAGPLAAWSFVAARLAGLALVVPVVEELFWRGFLLRWLIHPDWRSRPVGEFTPGSFAVVTLLFTLAHPEWLAAAAYAALLNGLLYWRRDLWDCVVAHAVTNLALGVYILAAADWALW
jgi:CAAX prenyl protease-like protein